MSSSFTQTNTIDMSKEKDWPAHLGMLDWDSTSIVFTKRSLIEFLKYTGTTVDPNFTNISKLPRYAKFGKLSTAPNDAPVTSHDVPIDTSTTSTSEGFKPTRRVRTVPGGPHTDIFSNDDEDDALSTAPPKSGLENDVTTPVPGVPVKEETSGTRSGSEKPSRRVRTDPGGNSSMANLWDPAEPEEFIPTRRVRQGPGGQDHINGLF